MMGYFIEKMGSNTEVIVYLTPYWQAWENREYSPNNYAWLTEWAVNGDIPQHKVKTAGGVDPVKAELERIRQEYKNGNP